MSAHVQSKPLQVRRHANGRLAEISLQADGRFCTHELLSDRLGVRGPVVSDIDSLRRARTIADQVAHPG
jgi:hypothetical protein